MEFRWIDWNREHIADHGVSEAEVEFVVRRALPPYPRRIEFGKLIVWGPNPGGRLLQVIYLEDLDGSVFVIHARPLTYSEKRRYRRRYR